MQNKQGTGGGVLTASPMLKSNKEIRRVNTSVFQYGISLTPFVAIPLLFMKEEDDQFFMESECLRN